MLLELLELLDLCVFFSKCYSLVKKHWLVCTLPLLAVLLECSSSSTEEIKTYSILSLLKATTQRCLQTSTAHNGTWNASANRAMLALALAPGILCTHCRQLLATWEFQRTYGSMSLGNSLCQNLNKWRAIPPKAINCLLSATHKDTHVQTLASHANTD